MNPLTLLLLASLGGCALRSAGGGTLQPAIRFSEYSPLASSGEIVRRTLPPLTQRYGQQVLARKGQALREHPVDLAEEEFAVYVPAGPPPKEGYGLLVFVSPGDDALQPVYWRAPLDRHRVIFVCAARSGNEALLLERRIPLAVLAWQNVRARYPIDPARVYVGGLSGGSRVAEMLALGYPDLFRGALLNAGSDPIDGTRGIYLPPADLFHQFQRTRVVFVTGAHDDVNLDDDAASRHSLRDFCVFDTEVKQPPRLGHELMDANALDGALSALERPPGVEAGRLSECNARLERELSAQVALAEAALVRGDRDGARELIRQLDGRYGGLAAPAVLELDARLTGH